MKCPNCGNPLKVVKTHTTGPSKLQRLHCQTTDDRVGCGKRVMFIGTLVEEVTNMSHTQRKLEEGTAHIRAQVVEGSPVDDPDLALLRTREHLIGRPR